MANHVLANYPAFTVLGIDETNDIQLDDDKGYARTSKTTFMLRSFPGDRYEFIRGFCIGCDGDNPSHVWAYGAGAMITAEKRAKEIRVGIELGQVITVEGKRFRVRQAANHNISLEAV